MRAGLRAIAGAALAAIVGCKPAPEPRLAAACGPDGPMEQVICKIRNNGTAASRACFTARIQPEGGGPPIIARRICTAVLEPGQATEVTPPFEQLERVRRNKTIASRCAREGTWACKVDVVETPQEMAGR